MEGRWTIWKDDSGTGTAASIAGEPCDEVPVVPCDDAAIARAACAVEVSVGISADQARAITELVFERAADG